MQRLSVRAAGFTAAIMLCTAAPAFADICATVQATVDPAALGFLRAFAGIPYWAAIGVALVSALLTVLLDGSNLQQFAKWCLIAIIIGFAGIAVLKWFLLLGKCGF